MYSFKWVFAVRTIGRHATVTMQNGVQSRWLFDRGSDQYYSFYRAMHFSAKRGIAIACRLSVRLSVRPSVRPSVTLVNCDHIG